MIASALSLLLCGCSIASAQGGGDGQAPPVNPDLLSWFASTAALSTSLVALVAFIRGYLWKGLEGERVGWFTLGLGAAVGALGQAAGYVRVEPYASMPVPLGGALFGLIAAVGAVGFVTQVYRTAEKIPRAEGARTPMPEGDTVPLSDAAPEPQVPTSGGRAPN